MGGEWPTEKVADLQSRGVLLVEDGNHGEYRPRRDEFVESGTAFIRAADMEDGRVLFSSAGHINGTALNRIRKGIGAGGDILLSHKGTVGKVARVPIHAPPFVCSPQTTFWRTLDESRINRDFLYSYMRSAHFHSLLQSRQNETDMAAYVSLTAQREFDIPVPRIDVQRKIARLLTPLDDKIELNRQMNRTLEAMARAIFKAWFLDFEPVKAKAAGATSFRGMPQPVFDQLPDRFTETELGPVPEGWEVKPLGDVLDVTMGQSPPSEYYNEDGKGLPFHQGVRDYGFRYPVHRVSCTLESRLADEGDVLLSVRAPVGRINVADRRMVIGRGLAAVKHRDGHSSYALYLLKHMFAVEDAVGDGTIYKAITKKFLLGMPVVSPSRDIAAECEKLLKPLDSLVETNEKESQTLAALRDILLPKLISGELRVPVAGGGVDGG